MASLMIALGFLLAVLGFGPADGAASYCVQCTGSTNQYCGIRTNFLYKEQLSPDMRVACYDGFCSTLVKLSPNGLTVSRGCGAMKCEELPVQYQNQPDACDLVTGQIRVMGQDGSLTNQSRYFSSSSGLDQGSSVTVSYCDTVDYCNSGPVMLARGEARSISNDAPPQQLPATSTRPPASPAVALLAFPDLDCAQITMNRVLTLWVSRVSKDRNAAETLRMVCDNLQQNPSKLAPLTVVKQVAAHANQWQEPSPSPKTTASYLSDFLNGTNWSFDGVECLKPSTACPTSLSTVQTVSGL